MNPLRYQNAKYEDVPQKIRELFEKIPQTKKGIYIYGELGTGKTHIAYALKSKTKFVRVFNTTELLRSIRNDFNRLAYEKDHLEIEAMDYPGILILDDVGSEKISDWVMETFYLIINKRYNHMLPTIITSNLPITDLSERIGDRITSRIVEMCDIVELVGSDRRLINKDKIQVLS